MTLIFDLTAAQDALYRSNYGIQARPGDAELIAAYEGYCQQDHDRFERKQWDRERREWLATQCPDCEPGGTGEQCDDCWVNTAPVVTAPFGSEHGEVAA